MNIKCNICLKNITPPHVTQSLPLDARSIAQAGNIGASKRPIMNFVNRKYQQYKSWYDYFCREGVFTREENDAQQYYCQRCGPNFSGVVENVNFIHNMVSQRRELETGSPVRTISATSAIELVDLYPGETSSIHAVGRRSMVQTTDLAPELSLDDINFDVHRLTNKLIRAEIEPLLQQLYRSSQEKVNPIMFHFLLELSANLRRLFQIVSVCHISYLDALTHYDRYAIGITNYAPDQFLVDIQMEIKENYQSLEYLYHAFSGGYKLERYFYMLGFTEDLAEPKKIRDLLVLADKADIYKSVIGSQGQLHPARGNDFKLLPSEFYKALFIRMSKYEPILEQVSIGAGCTLELCALWIVCPELRTLTTYATRQGLSLTAYIEQVVVVQSGLTSEEVHEIIFISAQNFLMMLYQTLVTQEQGLNKLPEKIRRLFGYELADFRRIISEESPNPLVLNSALKTIADADGASALRGSPSRPRRRAATIESMQSFNMEGEQVFDSANFWAANQFSQENSNFDERMRCESRSKGCSVMFHVLLSVSPLLQSYQKKAKGANISLQFYILRLSGLRQRRSEIMKAILTDAKQNVVKINDYAFDQGERLKELSTLLHHVTLLKPEAIENLIFAYDERALNVVYHAPVVVTLELVLCVLLLVFLVYMGYHIYNSLTSSSEHKENSSTTPLPRTTPHQRNITTTPRPTPAHINITTTPRPTPAHINITTTPKPTPAHINITTTPKPTPPHIPTRTTTTTNRNECTLPGKGAVCSTLEIEDIERTVNLAIKKGVPDFVGYQDACPNVQIFLQVLNDWYGANPDVRDKLDAALQGSLQLFVNFLQAHLDCK